MKSLFTLILSLLCIYCYSQKKINVILVGTMHFNNPGKDAVKSEEIDILKDYRQNSLEKITNKIAKKYKPSKVFVEYPSKNQKTLEKFYDLYKAGKPYFQEDTLTKSWQKRYFEEGEIFQFGFRLAKKAENTKVYAMDYPAEMRFDLFQQKAKEMQTIEESAFQEKIKESSNKKNSCFSKSDLANILKCFNTEEELQQNKGIYINLFNRLNKTPDFYGSDLVSGWYRRNLIMYSTIQNTVSNNDENIVIIVGQGHAAMMQEFIKLDDRFNLIKISEAL
ncbi:DUF5694 domain-containing protein [Chryseobacterium mulctrae]|uniref:DUF5694 domain-containing protein n=1 Tax=Chryseobacterium mulctrae TaxID=2576777 RepID=UPI0011160372|nr:DUF5694 domain-containing protein [Chryseobacterium mulctrae]